MPTIDEVLQRGWQLHQAGRVDEALQVYRNVLAQVPRCAEALVYIGIAQFDRREFDQSVASYREALSIRDNFPIAWNNLGNSLRMLGEIDQAESCFAKALQQQPGYLSALKNRGTLWVWAGEIKRGLHWYAEGLRVDPDHVELHRNLGVIYLLLGDYQLGWPEYRWRWRMPGMSRPQVSAPLWQGEELAGKTILLYPEQGRGDAIHFVRMASMLHNVGATVYLQCSSQMMGLFSSVHGVAMLLPNGSVTPPVDFHASLVDVVDVWYSRTGELTYGLQADQESRGYLDVPAQLVAYWQRWLDQNAAHATDLSRRIGINWQGNPEHHADVYRSLPLAALRPLSEIEHIELVNLQFGHGLEQLDQCGFAESLVRLPDGVDTTSGAFMDTAAILKNLDRVVTSDTAVAHLAGALGVPVTVMLGKVPDWRWLLQSETTPWYPSMKLIRQRELGDWSAVVEEVAQSI